MRKLKVVFTGGGTGGHVFPGIAVAEKLLLDSKGPSLDITWIGSRSGMEKEILRRYRIPFISIPAGKLRRYFSIYNFFDLFKIIAGFFSSFFILKKLKPDLLFSKGGFVTVPPVIAAKFLGIPVISHESDLDTGLATRINGRFSKIMLFAYEETFRNWKGMFPAQKKLVSGNPVRKEILEGDPEKLRLRYKIPNNKKIILVLGGSQGALEINNLIDEIIDDLCSMYFVIHQMGSSFYKESTKKNYITASLFNENFPEILSASDLVVSRAGAGTLWENGVLGKPAILIPLGSSSSRGDQVRNADFFEAHGAAIVLKDEKLNSKGLLDVINNLFSEKKVLNELEKNVKLLCNTNSADIITAIIKQEAG
jgi:UDP-N-acetylglucosamine--N-acetylmuramyl-(pentapeptide) pyrophosphoryl-undecaprenol N-acetylglucosamine transferase